MVGAAGVNADDYERAICRMPRLQWVGAMKATLLTTAARNAKAPVDKNTERIKLGSSGPLIAAAILVVPTVLRDRSDVRAEHLERICPFSHQPTLPRRPPQPEWRVQ